MHKNITPSILPKQRKKKKSIQFVVKILCDDLYKHPDIYCFSVLVSVLGSFFGSCINELVIKDMELRAGER